MRSISSWGRLSSDPHNTIALDQPALVPSILSSMDKLGLPYGMGRSYGDVCLNKNGCVWMTENLAHFISFDEESGRIICETGVLLKDIQQLVIPRGWILPVSPGTGFVTVGGAIANDVHGKNHHKLGSFGHHVVALKLVRTTGEIITCGREVKEDWFSATVGGIGLTGVIVEAEIQLQRVAGPWIDVETHAYTNLNQFLELSDSSEKSWEYAVSWIDCLSQGIERGIFMRGNSCQIESSKPKIQLQKSVLFTPPIPLVNPLSVKLFNSFYYNLNKRKKNKEVVHYASFLYPLDNILEWNKIYGPSGFYQYQCVVPLGDGGRAIKEILKQINLAGTGSFLSVLKIFGSLPSMGMLSFPRQGITLALDFPNKGANLLKLFEKLDAVVMEVGGCLYLAKDARQPRILFERGYPRLNEFQKYRDPGISSDMSRRLMGS